MNNKHLLLIVVLLIPIAVISFVKDETNFLLPKKEAERTSITVRLKLTKTNEIVELPLEEYLVGVVAAEMPALFHIEALKAQAIAARTYALKKINNNNTYDLVDTTDNQAYITIDEMKEKWQDDFELYYEKIKKSVFDTENLVVTYEKELITAYYFAMSNGYTDDASMVWGESADYLKSVESTWDNESLKNYSVETKISTSNFCQKLKIECQSLNIIIKEISTTNKVLELEINGKKMKGTEFRKTFGLRSTDFNLTIDEDYVYVETRGYGHGVGMSQYGANGMAKEGKNYTEILGYYYQNTKVLDYNSV